MDGWMGGWMDGWMGRWMDGASIAPFTLSLQGFSGLSIGGSGISGYTQVPFQHRDRQNPLLTAALAKDKARSWLGSGH